MTQNFNDGSASPEPIQRTRLYIALRNAGADLKAQARAIIAYKDVCAPFALQWAQRTLEAKPLKKKKGKKGR